MDDASQGQLIKAGLLLVAAVAFAWWQFRDLAKARRETQWQRTEPQANKDQQTSGTAATQSEDQA